MSPAPGNVFTALVPPEQALRHLDGFLAPLRREGPGADPALRWVPRERWHLTVTFHGPLAQDAVDGLLVALPAAVGQRGGNGQGGHDGESSQGRQGPLSLRLESGGHFGDRVLWAGLAGDVERAASLARACRRASRRARAAVERRPFRPHLTVARTRGRTRLAPVVSALQGYTGPAWMARELLLLRSTGGPAPRYDVLGRFPLTG